MPSAPKFRLAFTDGAAREANRVTRPERNNAPTGAWGLFKEWPCRPKANPRKRLCKQSGSPMKRLHDIARSLKGTYSAISNTPLAHSSRLHSLAAVRA